MENSEHHAHPRTPPDTDQRRLVTHLHGSGPVTLLASRVMVPHADIAQEPLKAEYTFIPKLFHPMTLSSKINFIPKLHGPEGWGPEGWEPEWWEPEVWGGVRERGRSGGGRSDLHRNSWKTVFG